MLCGERCAHLGAALSRTVLRRQRLAQLGTTQSRAVLRRKAASLIPRWATASCLTHLGASLFGENPPCLSMRYSLPSYLRNASTRQGEYQLSFVLRRQRTTFHPSTRMPLRVAHLGQRHPLPSLEGMPVTKTTRVPALGHVGQVLAEFSEVSYPRALDFFPLAAVVDPL